MKKTMWVTSGDLLPKLLNARTDEDKFRAVTFAYLESDMTDVGWIKVGECEISANFTTTDEVKERAIAVTEEAIQKLETDTRAKLHVLKAFRSELLCLEAPKASND